MDEISFFNQPIDLNNEELFYYKCKTILYFDLESKKDYSRDVNKFKLKHNLIKKILEKNIFENNEITKNIDKLDLIVFLISEPENDEDKNNYLLNL